MSELKTQPNDASVEAFIQSVNDEKRRNDCLILLPIMQRITQKAPKMWGSSIIGFGSYHYKNRSSREGDWFMTGFSPRKREMTVYIMPGFQDYAALLEKLGKHRLGKSCLYIKRLSDVDMPTLEDLITRSISDMESMYECD
ncbi:MAG: DUF1801 domain-containing protein [Leptolyngbya sp. SIO1D8]|nr:DUF1801 domain-containing protein [Leptolyngbya sp. SIO1D8]